MPTCSQSCIFQVRLYFEHAHAIVVNILQQLEYTTSDDTLSPQVSRYSRFICSLSVCRPVVGLSDWMQHLTKVLSMSHINFPTLLGHQQRRSQLKGRAELAERHYYRTVYLPCPWNGANFGLRSSLSLRASTGRGSFGMRLFHIYSTSLRTSSLRNR
jgi:hypothetical protein